MLKRIANSSQIKSILFDSFLRKASASARGRFHVEQGYGYNNCALSSSKNSFQSPTNAPLKHGNVLLDVRLPYYSV